MGGRDTPPWGGNNRLADGARRDQHLGRAVLVLAGQVGPLAAGLGPLSTQSRRSPIEVVLSAEVRLHALEGKKDGHAFTPNEEMKLDYQDRFITRTCQEWF